MKKTFEESIKELEGIVEKLEKGDASLDASLDLFEQGIKLSKSCQKMLESAEKRVSVLLKDDSGTVEKQDFLPEEE